MAGGQHHHRTNLDKYHPGYFGKVGMRYCKCCITDAVADVADGGSPQASESILEARDQLGQGERRAFHICQRNGNLRECVGGWLQAGDLG